MDAYPAHYLAHNMPLIVLSGLGTPDPNAVDEIEQQYKIIQENGFRISSDLPDVTGQKAEDLLNCFREFDAQDAAWNNRPGQGKLGSMGFTYRCVGRSITFPPHKDVLPSNLEQSMESSGPRRQNTMNLHSPLSPLSPNSPLYPDGLMTPLWFTKHQLLLPSVIALFFSLASDPNRVTLEDNRLKNEINAIKTSIVESGYKTRLIVVLVAEDDAVDPSAVERVANLRRLTNLDSKTIYHLPGYTTPVELRAFVGNLLSTLQPSCVEYYRDLSKHARRKRNKGGTPVPTVPPPPNSRPPVSSAGWTVRYETKLGAFAEFRQEMDAAGRSFETAYETLLDGDLFDNLEFGSQRFKEQRLLADVLALRILRCLLWTAQTTSAVQSWLTHRNRIRDLIQQKSEAANSYGWHAWDAGWTKIMAELVEKVDLPVFNIQPEVRSPGSTVNEYPMTFAMPEKNMANDNRLTPWESLHHSGYWLARSAAKTKIRRQLAQLINSEDQLKSADTNDNSNSKINRRFDSYLCPEPHQEQSFDYSSEVISTLKSADRQFAARDQPRASENARLDMGLEYMRSKDWVAATQILRPLWQTLSWRHAQWWDLVYKVSSSVKKCAAEIGDWEMYLAAQWEMLCYSLPQPKASVVDFHNCLEGFELSRKPHASLDYDDLAPTFTAKFCFSKARGNAGVPEPAQLVVTFATHSNVAPITLEELAVSIEGNLKGLKLVHDHDIKAEAEQGSQTQLFELGAPDIAGSTQSTNLEFTPGQSKIFSLKLIPREAGEVKASSVTLKINVEKFMFEITIPLRESPIMPTWWEYANGGLSRKRLALERSCALTVLPKPPKLRLTIPSLRSTYYIDEVVELMVSLENEEDDTADTKLNVTLSGTSESVPTLFRGQLPEDGTSPALQESPSRLEDHEIGKLAPNETSKETLSFKAIATHAELFLVVRADYFLLSDPETPVTVVLKEKLTFIHALEANVTFSPRLDTQPWPSCFLVKDASADSVNGLQHRWAASARITSFAPEPVIVESAALEIANAKYGVNCKVVPEHSVEAAVPSSESISRTFDIFVQKLSIEDRRAALISFQLHLNWRRDSEGSKRTTSTLLVPSLTVPFGEPRVLCSATKSTGQSSLINLTYTLENPSTHLLSFTVTLETSDEFGFSGPKAKMLQLVPLSRTEIKYNLMPFEQGVWVHPYLRVTDTGFGQDLKVIAVDGCKNEKKAIAVWIDEEQ